MFWGFIKKEFLHEFREEMIWKRRNICFLVEVSSFSTYNPFVSFHDQWWNHKLFQHLVHQYPMKLTYWQIHLSIQHVHLNILSTSIHFHFRIDLPKNSFARKRALCNPSYHSGNSFFSFKPPMISFITSSHSSMENIIDKRGRWRGFWTNPNRYFHPY